MSEQKIIKEELSVPKPELSIEERQIRAFEEIAKCCKVLKYILIITLTLIIIMLMPMLMAIIGTVVG